MELVGNFGEIRPNHFHAGFDLRTNGVEGMPVYAIEDGYVSRIKISAKGYGKAIYINHPNGYTSVYGHLQGFINSIAEIVSDIQYSNETFEFDTIFNSDKIPVKKGQQIAFSGNTGSSGGPHLHFEIRNTKTEMPINPYFFGYKIPDSSAPKIIQLAVIPIGNDASVNGKQGIKKINVSGNNNVYHILNSDSIYANGEIGFGIKCYDKENGSANHNGVYSIELQLDGNRIYFHQLESFSFENSRFVNAHIVYEEKERHNEIIEKCFLSKNDKLGIYKDIINRGIVDFNDELTHHLKYIVKDFIGNSAEVTLKVRSDSKNITTKYINVLKPPHFDCLKDVSFEEDEFKLSIPAESLYDDIDFTKQIIHDSKSPYSPLIQLFPAETAFQKDFTLSIIAARLPDSLQNKACIVSISDKGKINYEGGEYVSGWVTARTKHFGKFKISIDNKPPVILLNSNSKNKSSVDYSKAKTIKITAKDELSGIKKYRATIDGKWVLCEYEPKKDLLFYTFDEKVKSGEHTFKIEVTDDKNNTSRLSFKFNK